MIALGKPAVLCYNSDSRTFNGCLEKRTPEFVMESRVLSMLQDLSFGVLDNQYRYCQPQGNDLAVCVRGNEILLARAEDGTLSLPCVEQVESWRNDWEQWLEEPYRYGFTMQERRYFLWMGAAGEPADGRYRYIPASVLREPANKELCFAVMTAWHLYSWYRSNRFCGRCGHAAVHDGKERMMRCPACGNMMFPRIAPAAIIGVTHGDRLILSKYANREYTRYGLIAGFIEIGETAEEAVAREVMEEVGLKVKNIRYYKSQPWGIAGNLQIGYFCDLDGEDETVTLDEDELASAEWFSRDAIPYRDEGISLTGEMIRIFQEGREPK